jgi:hypothetical protein
MKNAEARDPFRVPTFESLWDAAWRIQSKDDEN